MGKRVIEVREKSKLDQLLKRGKASYRHRIQNSLVFEEKIIQALNRVFKNSKVKLFSEIHNPNFVLHLGDNYTPNGEFYTPDAHLANEDISLPVEVKWLTITYPSQFDLKYRERGVDSAARYVTGKLFVRDNTTPTVIEEDCPPAEKVLMITNEKIDPKEIKKAEDELKVHTIGLHELEKIMDHIPDGMVEDKETARESLRKEKIRIMKFFGIKED